MGMKVFGLILLAGLVNGAIAMEAQTAKLVVWRRGESIAGEEFVAASEAVVDYLATLERPTENFKVIKYSCQIKQRAIAPSFQTTGEANTVTSSVVVRMVYELRDCKKLD
jgi:hypothetical protein